MSYTVGEVAKIAHISIRALHYYDEIGLLSPSMRSPSGYRLYSEADLQRLQQILLYRELGFRLDEIGRLLDQPETDRRQALMEQRNLLLSRSERLQAVLTLLDRVINQSNEGFTMSHGEMFGIFEDFNPANYQEEAEARWGETDAYRTSAQRMKHYTADDWQRIKQAESELLAEFSRLLAAGVAADDVQAMNAAEAYRQHICRWFYRCSPAMHAELGAMYESDARFKQHFDKVQPGLAAYVRAATAANLARDIE